MKRHWRSLLLCLISFGVLVCLGPATLQAQNSDTEHIRDFSVSAIIHPDASVRVSETIVYDFGPNQKHGIYRDIPVKYKTDIGNRSISLTDISVVDESGRPQQFVVSSEGQNKRIKIGDPNILISGVRTYIISYTITRIIGYFDTYDELYWNVTGTEWQVPIDHVSASISLSQPVSVANLKIACYWGYAGSTDTCTGTPNGTDTATSVSFALNRGLAAQQNMTAAIGFPKGLVLKPTVWDMVRNFLFDNGILILPVIVFVLMFVQWSRHGRDPKGPSTIVAEYDPPDNLTPLEVSMVLHQTPKSDDIPAEIIQLAVKGFIKIDRTTEKVLLFDSTDYTFTKLKNISEAENPIDTALLTALFFDDTGNEGANEIKLSSLKNSFYKKISDIQKPAIDSVIEKGYYLTNPNNIIFKYAGFGVAIIAISIFASSFLVSINPLYFVSTLASGIIILIFSFFMPAVTEKGAIARAQIKGLKEYIVVAEEARIKFHDAPEKNPQLFEKLLPYAMVLGVEKEWAKQFEGIYTMSPAWYHDPSGNAFNAVIFANNLSSFRSAASSTMSSSPRGGSGGGGFSGGGGGGGGGGSW